jgi:hypothetical protein
MSVVELFFNSTARYILPEVMIYGTPNISQITEFIEQYRRNWKYKVTSF